MMQVVDTAIPEDMGEMEHAEVYAAITPMAMGS